MDCGLKSLYASVAVTPAPVRVPTQRSLGRVSRLSANDKDDEMISGTMHRSPGICPAAKENPGKPQLGDRR